MAIKRGIGIFLWLSGALLLAGLGFWQQERLVWKTAVIAALDAEYARDPNQNRFDIRRLDALGRDDKPMVHGRVDGRLMYDREIVIGPRTQNEKVGYHILTPLSITGGGVIFVHRGFREEKKLNPETCACGLPRETVRITGILRKPDDRNPFTPPNSPLHHEWTHMDIQAMADAGDLTDVAAVIMFADAAIPSWNDAVPVSGRWYPRNEHRNYMIFWFTMAVIWTAGGLILMRRKSRPVS